MAHCNRGCRAHQCPAPCQRGESSGYLGRGGASRVISETAAGKGAWVIYVHLGQGVGKPQATSQLCPWTYPAHSYKPMTSSHSERAWQRAKEQLEHHHGQEIHTEIAVFRTQRPKTARSTGRGSTSMYKKKKEHHGNVSCLHPKLRFLENWASCSYSIQVAVLSSG